MTRWEMWWGVKGIDLVIAAGVIALIIVVVGGGILFGVVRDWFKRRKSSE